MFDRFTRDARVIIGRGQEIARRQGGPRIEPEHLLLAITETEDCAAGSILREHGVTRQTLEPELAELRRRGRLSESDTAALEELGIDVERIVHTVERVHGPNALAGRRRFRRRQPFSAESKRVVERMVRESAGTGGRTLESEHLLLSLATSPGPVADILARHGVDPLEVRKSLAQRRAS